MDVQCSMESSDSPESYPTDNYDRYGFRAGKQFTDPSSEQPLPIKILRARELKWIEMCNNWEHWIKSQRPKVTERCRKGIPDSMRAEAWQRLCNSPMVLVARPKVFSVTSDSIKKQNNSKNIFEILSRRNASRSLPTVITTSPSFRVKKGKDKDRQQYLLNKLYGPNSTIQPTFLSTTTPRHPTSKTSDCGDQNINLSTASNIVYPWPHAEPNGDSSGSPDLHCVHHDNDSFHSLIYDSSAIVTSCSTGPSPLTSFAIYTTTAAVHQSTAAAAAAAPCFTVLPQTVPTVTTSGSGGYASLSTNSATDSASIQNLAIEPLGPNFTDSCSSSLRLSSFGSSSSALWLQRQSVDRTTSNEDLATDLEDARATLVPTLVDPDPAVLYEQYCMQEGDPASCDQIRRDIDRQFPFHELFTQKGGHGQESLYTLLKAYTVRHSEKGYCQGQAPLAAVLLMFMPEVDAFWTFNEVCERYLVAYYDEGLERVQIDAEILYALLKRKYPSVYKHLKNNEVSPLFIAMEWFMCVYTRTLPWATVLRVLDMFFCEGKVVLFRVGLVLLHRLFGTRALRKAHASLEDIMTRLREVHSVVPDASDFVRETLRLELTPRIVAQEAISQSRKWDRKKKLQMASDAPVV